MLDVDHLQPCHYKGEHPPHLWAFQAPSHALMGAGCPGVVLSGDELAAAERRIDLLEKALEICRETEDDF